jgi:hypothetical protein
MIFLPSADGDHRTLVYNRRGPKRRMDFKLEIGLGADKYWREKASWMGMGHG